MLRARSVLRVSHSQWSVAALSSVRTPAVEGEVIEAAQSGKPFNRYRLIPLAMANHLALGSVYAWSIFNKPLMRLDGVVAQSASDWVLSDVSITFSLVMGGFVWGAVLSKKLDQWGPRVCGLAGAACLGSGFGLAALAVNLHSLPVLYAGGLVWGLSNGLAYVPPVAMLLKWFPEKKGFAGGACLVGFGGGALVAAPLFTNLLNVFRQSPTFVGPTTSVAVTNNGGKLFAEYNGALSEVVAATAADIKSWPGLSDGLYLVGSGSTGVGSTFMCLGAGYAVVMALAALGYRLPTAVDLARLKIAPVGGASAAPAATERVTTFNVPVSVATRTPQFAMLWAGFGMSIMGSYGILAAGSTMQTETFGGQGGAFAASFVAAMSFANLVGRLFWSNASDALNARSKQADPFWGRRTAYSVMWGMGAPLYLLVLWSIHSNAAQPSTLAFAMFSLGVCGIISSFGGGAATWPAICGDLWGTKNVGILAARQLSVALPAAFIGPRLVSALRESDMVKAIKDLSTKVPDDVFLKTFGASKDALDVLIASKTVTINRLLELIDAAGVVDPTPFLYDRTLMIMACLQGTSFVVMRLLKPVDPKFHEKQ